MIAQHVSVQLEVVGDELVVGTECLPSASLRALRLKGVFAEFFAARKPRVSPRSWAEHVDQLGEDRQQAFTTGRRKGRGTNSHTPCW